ncbi:MAG: alpha/beta fold hydrolase [Microcoleaceae cyanobacterium]
MKNRFILCFVGAVLWLSACNADQNTAEDNDSEIQAEQTVAKEPGTENTLPKENSSDPRFSTVPSEDGSLIFYGAEGEGDTTLMFVHCWTCNHEFWTPQIKKFSEDYQVVWLDLAGHGKSGSNRQEYTMSAFGQDVAAVVNQVATDKVVLVGHSMGGPVVMEAAKLLGDRVIGIVGVDTFYTPFEYPDSEEQIATFVQPFEEDFQATSEQLVRSMFTPAADPAVVDSVVTQMGDADQQMAISALSELFEWNVQDAAQDLAKYDSKLRNINGAPTGQEVPLDDSVTLIPNVGHFVAQSKPDEFNQVLEDILAEFQNTP